MGDYNAKIHLINLYHGPFALKRNPEKAIEILEDLEINFEKNSNEENNKSYYSKVAIYTRLGDIYHSEKNFVKALENFKKAINEIPPSAHAYYVLGRMTEKGEGVEKNRLKAVKYFYKAADLKHEWAFKRLSVLYKFGWGVEKNIEKSNEFLNKYELLGQRKDK